MTHPDGWKDEEADVDEFSKPKSSLKDLPLIKSPDTSARSCGCDPGAKWVCVWHQKMGDK